jgi:hypothetical protein
VPTYTLLSSNPYSWLFIHSKPRSNGCNYPTRPDNPFIFTEFPGQETGNVILRPKPKNPGFTKSSRIFLADALKDYALVSVIDNQFLTVNYKLHILYVVGFVKDKR